MQREDREPIRVAALGDRQRPPIGRRHGPHAKRASHVGIILHAGTRARSCVQRILGATRRARPIENRFGCIADAAAVHWAGPNRTARSRPARLRDCYEPDVLPSGRIARLRIGVKDDVAQPTFIHVPARRNAESRDLPTAIMARECQREHALRQKGFRIFQPALVTGSTDVPQKPAGARFQLPTSACA
jgi:hypothetical protein